MGGSWGGHQGRLLEHKQRDIAVGVKAHGASLPAFLRAWAGVPPLWMQLWALSLVPQTRSFPEGHAASRRPVLSRDAWPGHPELLKEVRPAGSSLAHLDAPCYCRVLAITGGGGRDKTQIERHTRHVKDIQGFPPTHEAAVSGAEAGLSPCSHSGPVGPRAPGL